jgi:hypothetical protein
MSKTKLIRWAYVLTGSGILFGLDGCTGDWLLGLAGAGGVASGLFTLFQAFS